MLNDVAQQGFTKQAQLIIVRRFLEGTWNRSLAIEKFKEARGQHGQ